MMGANKCGSAGAQLPTSDKTTIVKPDVQVVSNDAADFNPGRSNMSAGSSPLKVAGK